MKLARMILITLIVVLAACNSVSAQPERNNTLRVDAVELLDRSKDVEGRSEFSVTSGKFTYLFINEQNKAAFEVEQLYSQFHSVNGLNLPKRIDVSFSGTPDPHQSGEFAEQVIDDPADEAKLRHRLRTD